MMNVLNLSTSSEQATQVKEECLLPTVGELMRSVSQAVQRLYRDELSQKTKRVTCNLSDDKLVVWVEGSVTPIIRLLRQQSASNDIQTLSCTLQQAVNQRITEIVKSQLQVEVITLVSNTCYEKECTGLIVWLAGLPATRVARGPIADYQKESGRNRN